MLFYNEKYQYLTRVCLNLTDDCNLACKYCFVQQKPNYMSLETAKAAVDWLYNNLQIKKQKFNIKETEKVHINFFGGEPTLLWDQIIVPLTKYAFDKYPNEVLFTITTNGTLLNEKRIEFIKNNFDGLLLSIDGDKKTQNFNRPCKNKKQNSFDLVSANIPIILKYFPNTTFRSTIYKESIENMYENFLFAEKNNFKHTFLAIDERSGEWSQAQLNILKDQISKITFHQLKFFLNNQLPPLEWTQLYRSIREIYLIEQNTQNNIDINNLTKKLYRCGLGTATGSIGYDGSIYGCQEQDSRIKTNDLFYLGNIFKDGIEKDRHIKLIESWKNAKLLTCYQHEDICQTCLRRKVCFEQTCPSTSYDLFQNHSYSSYIQCFYLNSIFKSTISMSEILLRLNNTTFKNYINNILADKIKEE